MEDEKEWSMRAPKFLTTFPTCIELPGLPEERRNWSGGDRPTATNSRHCGGTFANGGFVSVVRPFWRHRWKAALSHWWHLGCRWQTTRIDVARSLTPEVPQFCALSPAAAHRPLALGRDFPLDRICIIQAKWLKLCLNEPMINWVKCLRKICVTVVQQSVSSSIRK